MDGVTLAGGYARRLVKNESRRSRSNVHAAIATVARRVKASPSTIWSLLYRAPKKMNDSLLSSLEEAVRREIELEIGCLNVELVAIRSGVRRIDPVALAEVETDLARLRAILQGDPS